MNTATTRHDPRQLRQLSLVPDDASDDGIIAAALAILEKRAERQTLGCPTEAATFLTLKLAGREREVFAVCFLDTRHRLIAYEELFQGTIDGCEIHPREVARRALQLNATAVLLAHNHPSSNPEPSAADRAVTARLKQALALIDVRVVDHIVVGGGSHVSMAARGWV